MTSPDRPALTEQETVDAIVRWLRFKLPAQLLREANNAAMRCEYSLAASKADGAAYLGNASVMIERGDWRRTPTGEKNG